MPRRFQLLCAPNYSVNNLGVSCGFRWRFESGCNIQFRQTSKYWIQSAFLVAKKETATNPYELPTEAFKNCLTFGVLLKFLWAVVSLTVALNGKTTPVSCYNKVDTICPNVKLWQHGVVRLHEPAKH